MVSPTQLCWRYHSLPLRQRFATHSMLLSSKICSQQTNIFLLHQNLRINSLWPSDAIWRQRSGSTLAQVLACCLMAPSHYLNQCCLLIKEVLWPYSTANTPDTILYMFDNYNFKITAISPRGQWVKHKTHAPTREIINIFFSSQYKM